MTGLLLHSSLPPRASRPGFPRLMEADESGVPPRPVAGDVHIPASRSAKEPIFMERHGGDLLTAMASSPDTTLAFHAARPVSISLPASPTGFDVARSGVELQRHAMTDAPCMLPLPGWPAMMAVAQPDRMIFRSQPIAVLGGAAALPQQSRSSQVHDGTSRDGAPRAAAAAATTTGKARGRRDTSYDSFKTWSGKLEKQITTHLRGGRQQQQQQQPEQRRQDEEPEDDDAAAAAAAAATTASSSRSYSSMPRVQRFFAALEGPELDKLRSSEALVLPSDKTWPFLLRFPVSAFGMCMGMSSQAILWKNIAISTSTRFLHITVKINLVLWCVSVALMCAVSALYACKVAFYFEAVRREYYHPVRVNFFFAPWIACLFLAIGVPPMVAASLPHWLWYLLMAPIVCLELKIYGQWISGGQRRLSRVANPSNHLSIVGNFVGALLGATMGLREGPIFFFAVGLAHYIVLFVTLYQRLPTSETLPRDLHPVFFLFVAAPSVACLAWARITGEFGYGSRVAYFIAMFLYASLAVRINLFRGFRFSLAWWAYTFPMTSAAIASIRYSSEVKNAFTQSLCIALSVLATLTVTALFLTTLLHAAVHRDLFPNDISIAITERKLKPIAEIHEQQQQQRDKNATTAADIHPDSACIKDLEAGVPPPPSYAGDRSTTTTSTDPCPLGAGQF
ncbi:S-type anion channel SLAH2 isoform X7 [Oryza sativa Japonica Group]|uniref:S-type anion channel SLAH2 isoform X7 n=2 Tax=Oryza sativa subsp. japonica TaxID=39947 RepID=UPI0007754C6E|nr:S-type anion channel SLAH3 isoform X6 [Oryza sativa Japonica Group]